MSADLYLKISEAAEKKRKKRSVCVQGKSVMICFHNNSYECAAEQDNKEQDNKNPMYVCVCVGLPQLSL